MVSTIGKSRGISADVFGDLPDALINELLTRADAVGDKARSHVYSQVRIRDSLRKRALKLGLVKQLPDQSVASPASVVAVDGSLVSKRFASLDLNAAAALAVDGVGSTLSRKDLRHEVEVHVTRPSPYGREITYGLMFCMEYEIASVESAIVDVVMLDGAFSTGSIAISKALTASQNRVDDLTEDLFDRWTNQTARTIAKLMTSDRVIAVPKRSSANEFTFQTRLFENREINTNGRSTASLILDANEYCGPFSFDTRRPQTWPSDMFPGFRDQVSALFEEIVVVYFKPFSWSHAFRVEMPPSVGRNERTLHSVLDVVKRQCSNPAMFEPYPLYVADRFAKSLTKGVGALFDAVRSDLIAESEFPEIAHAMLNAYRTDPLIEEADE